MKKRARGRPPSRPPEYWLDLAHLGMLQGMSPEGRAAERRQDRMRLPRICNAIMRRGPLEWVADDGTVVAKITNANSLRVQISKAYLLEPWKRQIVFLNRRATTLVQGKQVLASRDDHYKWFRYFQRRLSEKNSVPKII